MKEFTSRGNKVRLALSYRITARIVYQDQHGLFLGTLFTIILDGIDEQSLFKELISVEDAMQCCQLLKFAAHYTMLKKLSKCEVKA